MTIKDIKNKIEGLPDDYDVEIMTWYRGIPIIRPILDINIDKGMYNIKFETVLQESGEA